MSDPISSNNEFKAKSDVPFYLCFFLIGGFYIAMIVAMLVAESTYTTVGEFFSFLARPEVRYSLRLSLLSCALSTILSLWVAVPIGYLMSRYQFYGKSFVDAVLDIPIVLPPLVVGLCLLILFSSSAALGIESAIHAFEQWLGDHLIAMLWFALFSAIGAAAFFLPKQKLNRVQITGVSISLLIFFSLLNHSHLLPSLPAWAQMPGDSAVANTSLTYCDQSPITSGSDVYRAEFEFTGTQREFLSLWESSDSEADLNDYSVKPILGDDGRETGEYRVTAPLAEDTDNDFPSGADLTYTAQPKKKQAKIDKLKEQLSEQEQEVAKLERLFNFNRQRAKVRDDLEAVRQSLNELRSQWNSKEALDKMPAIERQLEQVHSGMLSNQSEIDDLQHEIDTLKQLAKDGGSLNEVQSELKRQQQQVTALREEVTSLETAYQREPTLWTINLNVRRRQEKRIENWKPTLTIPVTYEIPSVILAQFMVACAFAVRTMRVTFDQIHKRYEHVALTLGCNRGQAFWFVVFPQCRRGLLAAGTLAWARSLGEFGPILIFSGATRLRTEVLPTTVFLEFSTGHLEGAVSASLIIIAAAMIVLVLARVFGLKRMAI